MYRNVIYEPEYSVQYAHNSDLDCLASHNQHLWISLVLDVLSQYY